MRLEASPTKVLAAERNVAVVRVAVIVLNVLVYLFLMGRAGTVPWLAYAVIAVALPYGFVVALFRPYERWPVLRTSVWTSATDAVLVTAWVAGTGGFASPFYLLWYVSLVAVAFRYDHRATLLLTGAYAALYVGELALLGDLAGHGVDVFVRTAYVVFVGALGSMFARESSRQALEREGMERVAEATALTSLQEPEPTLDRILGAALKLVGADRAAVYLLRPTAEGGRRLATAASRGLSPAYIAARERHFESLPGHRAHLTGQPIQVLDARSDLRLAPIREAVDAEGFRTYAVFPLKRGAERLGLLTLYRDEVRSFGPEEMATGWALANQAAIAIENQRLVEEMRVALETRRRTEEEARRSAEALRLVSAVAVAANEAVTLEEGIQRTLDLVCERAGWPVGHAYLAVPEDQSLRPTQLWHLRDPAFYGPFRQATEAMPMPPGVGLPGRVVVAGKPAWIEDVTKDANFPLAPWAERCGLRAAFGFPLLHDGRVAAVLEFFTDRAFAPDPTLLQTVENIGTQLGRVLERQRSMVRLQESEAKFRTLAETASDAIVSADSRGVIIHANQAAARIFGYDAHELTGQSLTLLMPERYHAPHRAGLQRYLETGEAHVVGRSPVELMGRRKDGAEFPVELSLASYRSGGEVFFTGIMRDVTERRRSEAERAAGEAERRELLRLKEQDAFKTQFINTAAHELKTPLTPIKLQLHLLKTSRTDLSAEQKRSIQILDRNVDRLSTLVQDVLDAARIQAGRLALNKRPIDLCPVAAEALESFREVARGLGVGLDASLEGTVAVDGDAQRLMQVLYNLLGNALKFTPAGGRVHVAVRKTSGECLVRVEDTGLGMTPDQLGRLFRPFSQVHEDAQTAPAGTGLGLYISRGIMEEHRGRIWAESRGPGQGSTFAFALPLTTATPVLTHRDEGAKRAERAADEAVSKRLRELI